jgi:ribosome-dependent ATPase
MAGLAGGEAAEMSQNAVASVRGLTHRFGETVAVDGVTLDVPAGCMAGLIGPDGVGKSTLMSLLSGVRRIQDGSVEVLDGDMRERAHRRTCSNRIAYMPQGLGRNLYPTLTVFENLDFFGRLFGQDAAERRRRIDDLLRATGLDPFPDRPAGKLSGGMKQKLSLCSALIHDPDLVILDEPTTGVDPLSRRQFWELIDRIRADRPGMSVLVATAYMEEAERFDWLAAMSDGKVIATGTPAEIRDNAGAKTLESAFIAMLPEAVRKEHREVVVPPPIEHDGPPAIEARGLTRRFGDFTAVDHVDFRIARGEIFGFLGSNGCGKTTTMKMLTGLLPASEGEALLFGETLDARDMATRSRVGYMSQSFSLYSELSVSQNLDLHARLYQLPQESRAARIADVLEQFDLTDDRNARPEDLPLGVRQRLQLAVAVLHGPEILILDEPTSGVDPVARDGFWRHLIDLSRKDGVTIFISTHFMSEAERCDRISLMHAGKVLAVGRPQEIADKRGEGNLEDAFITYLKEAEGAPQAPADTAPARPDVAEAAAAPVSATAAGQGAKVPRARGFRFSPARMWALARREATEIVRDRLRLAFALLGPLLMMFTFSYGISFDVENLGYAVADYDRSRESRELLEGFAGARVFEEKPAEAGDTRSLEDRLRAAEIVFGVEIPSGFGRELLSGQTPEVHISVDGGMPFRAETTRGYLQGVASTYLADQMERSTGDPATLSPVSVETRFRYNQSFESVIAMVPSVIMLMLVLIPAMTAAVSVVREKETGSIANFHATPVTRTEFILGKQIPYAVLAFCSFLMLLLAAVTVFNVPVSGSLAVLCLGSALYVIATTGFGFVISTVTRSQVAATFAAAILAIIPAVNFSGLLVPVSSLTGSGRVIGLAFPAVWYQQISVGAFTKGLGLATLWPNLFALGGFSVLFAVIAIAALSKQER